MAKNPFGNDPSPQRVNPFGEPEEPGDTAESIRRIEHAARTVRRLKSQLGSEGLTLSATRELIDELSKALDATASALKGLAGRS